MKKNGVKWWIFAGVTAGCIVAGTCALWGVKAAEGRYRPENQDMIVIAHRAGGASAPENTVAALEQAIADRAEIAEVDIRQLKDGTLIVMHDSNFARTAGVDRDVWDTTGPEAAAMETSGRYYGRYRGAAIATLDEMLACARDRIKLMIEVKCTGQERDMVMSLIELLHVHDMDLQCIIGSMNQEILRQVKEIDPSLQTVYIAHFLEEEDYLLDYADSYSIEAANMTGEMVERIHAQGKPVYGWTANTRRTMKLIADYGADGIVTDDVPMAQSFLKIF